MHLLFVDESGDPGWCPPNGDSKTTWFVIGGLSIEETKWKIANKKINEIIKKYFPRSSLKCRELRYTTLIAGAPPYRELEPIKKKRTGR